MKNALLGLIVLTRMDGMPVDVESTQLSFVHLHGEHCEKAGGTVIQSGQTRLCVRETRDEIRRKKSDCENANKCN